MCIRDRSSSWDLKHRILSKFKDYIDLSALLPVYVKDNYDFTKVEDVYKRQELIAADQAV